MFDIHKEFGRKNLLGGVIQLVNFLGVGVNNLLVPSIIGANSFAMVAISLSMVYMLQGLFEVSFVGTTINLVLGGKKDIQEETKGKLRVILKDLMFGGSLCAALLFILAHYIALWFSKPELSVYLRIAALIIPFLAMTTFLLSLAYSRRVRHALITHVIAGIGLTLFPFLFCMVINGGGYGAMVSVLLTQVICGAYLAAVSSEDLRAIIKCRSSIQPGQKLNLRTSYVALTFPRLLFILISSGSVLVVGAVRTSIETAVYKLALSITLAFNRLIPASPYVFQASIRDMKGKGTECDTNRIVGKYIMVGVVLSVNFSILGYGLIPSVCIYILRAEHADYYEAARMLSLSQPLLFLITMLPAILMASERVKGLTMATLLSSVLYIISGPLLIYRAGIKGAALALLVAAMLATVWMVCLLSDLFKPYLAKFAGLLLLSPSGSCAHKETLDRRLCWLRYPMMQRLRRQFGAGRFKAADHHGTVEQKEISVVPRGSTEG